jgi:hypothetical protein
MPNVEQGISNHERNPLAMLRLRYSLFDIRYYLLPFFHSAKGSRIFLSGSLAAGDELYKENCVPWGGMLSRPWTGLITPEDKQWPRKHGTLAVPPPKAPIATSLVIGSQ